MINEIVCTETCDALLLNVFADGYETTAGFFDTVADSHHQGLCKFTAPYRSLLPVVWYDMQCYDDKGNDIGKLRAIRWDLETDDCFVTSKGIYNNVTIYLDLDTSYTI